MNKLYVVSTPIGNIKDISERAIDTLKEVKVVLAEDSRETSKLFKLIGIENKIVSLHKWNENEKTNTVIEYLKDGDVALVSDAGTPTISDPGQFLIDNLIQEGVEIVSVPGASAVISALSISGLKYKSFKFIGFLPKKENQIVDEIKNANADVLVAYDSPNRINKTLEIIAKHNEQQQVVVAREITKKFEEVKRGTASELSKESYKGEIVLLVKINETESDLTKKVKALNEAGLNNKEIIKYLMETEGFKKNEIYEELKNV